MTITQQRAETVGDCPTAPGWDVPVPLAGRPAVSSFPLAVFPSWLRDMAAAVAVFTQTDPTMAGTVALSVLSACVGGRLEVEAKPGWREPVNLYTAVIAEPGELKSPVHSALTRPLRAAEKTLQEGVSESLKEQETRKDIADRTADKARAEASKAPPERRDEAIAEAIAAAMDADAIEVPHLPRLFTDNSTPEALTSLMAANGGRFAIVSDEGGTFDILAGRYSANPDLDAYLKGHAGTPLPVDRRGRESEYIDAPALTIGIMAQPSKLRRFGGNEELSGNGMVARFLFALPTSLAGYRSDDDAHPVPAAIQAGYGMRIHDLAVEVARRDEPTVVTLSPEAVEVRKRQADAIELALRPGGRLRRMPEWAGKLKGTTLRLAGLLHLAHTIDGDITTPVSGDTMNKAVNLARFFVEHYQAAMDTIATDPDGGTNAYVLDVLTNKAMHQFTRRELHRKVSRQLPRAADVEAVLTVLAQLGWIRATEDGGYELHPHAQHYRDNANNLAVDINNAFGAAA